MAHAHPSRHRALHLAASGRILWLTACIGLELPDSTIDGGLRTIVFPDRYADASVQVLDCLSLRNPTHPRRGLRGVIRSKS